MVISAIFFIVWDSWFTKLGIWNFNDQFLTGVYLYNLPIEEVLFFFTIPYASMFLYEVLSLTVFNSTYHYRNTFLISLLLAGIFILISCINVDKAYTFTAFLFCSGLIVFLLVIRSKYLIRFYMFYLILLIPFFIVNGLLTGSFINRVVVGYNDMENLGIRFLTIPIEDFVYGMSMMLLNVAIYEYLKSRY
jgi:lycopene cyclase domain-containing protein